MALPGQWFTVMWLELLPEHQVSIDETLSARKPQSSDEDSDRVWGSPLKLWLNEYQEGGGLRTKCPHKLRASLSAL